MSRYMLLFFAAVALHADTIIFFDVSLLPGAAPSFEQLPDAPGGQLDDTIIPDPIPGGVDGCGLLNGLPECGLLLQSDDGLTPGPIGGSVTIGNGQPETVVDEIDYNGHAEYYYPEFILNFYAERGAPFTGCLPSICTDIIPATGEIQEVLTIPWLNSNGNVVRTDTIDVVSSLNAVAPEPHWEVFALGILFAALVIRQGTLKSVAHSSTQGPARCAWASGLCLLSLF